MDKVSFSVMCILHTHITFHTSQCIFLFFFRGDDQDTGKKASKKKMKKIVTEVSAVFFLCHLGKDFGATGT
jgi:hypothetical protein